MAGGLDISSGVMTITKDDRLVFSTDRPLLNLIPNSAIVLNDYDISFPAFWHGTVYHKLFDSSGPLNDLMGCASFTGFVEQEWGPGEASPNTLSDIIVGTVPDGTDYLDVMVNLTNTVVPAGWLDLTMKTNFPAGETVKLEGGSCLIEFFPGMRRLFEFVLDGTDVVLRRYQSITANGDVNRFYNNTSANMSPHYIGFVDGTNAAQDGVKKAIRGAIIQLKGMSAYAGNQNDYNPGGSQDCSQTSPSYASTWSGDIVITPGRIGA